MAQKKALSKKQKSKFLRIICPRCHEPTIVFGKSTQPRKCEKCNILLTETTGGKSRIKALVKRILWE